MSERFKKTPDGWFLTIDGEVVEEAGKNGVIQRKYVAERLRDSLAAKYPESEVTLVGAFTKRKDSV